ncbi:MAG: NAD(P)H-binding protein, partial [Bacteroidales bacterium]|nr:NAD(P)H-binding protein [Bacteroidales bacterium]
MAILLLGGNGLLGHNVLKQLLQQGHEVHALLRNASALHTADFPHLESLHIFQGSLLYDDDLRKAAQGCDAIINCAGVTDMSLLHYDDYLPVNRDLCGRILQLMEQQHITSLVHTSTANTIGFGSP